MVVFDCDGNCSLIYLSKCIMYYVICKCKTDRCEYCSVTIFYSQDKILFVLYNIINIMIYQYKNNVNNYRIIDILVF